MSHASLTLGLLFGEEEHARQEIALSLDFRNLCLIHVLWIACRL
jgi:hypothetical protein